MKHLDIPVLFITFARPEYARKTFDAIKAVKPKKLYIYSDKARLDNPDEIKKNNEIRKFVIEETDWDCELKTLFREENAGLYKSMLTSIDWIFENETNAIIFEEDIVPSLAFFDFCSQLLPKYESDKRVWYISGMNLFEDFNPNGYDYIFTRRGYYYGFATWKDRWEKVQRTNIPFEKMKNYGIHNFYGVSRKKIEFIINNEERAYKFLQSNGPYPCWDYAFSFTLTKEGGFGIIPIRNLVANIGVQGDHSTGGNSLVHNRIIKNPNKYKILNHPPFILPDYKYDKHHIDRFYEKNTLKYKLTNKVKKLLGLSK